MKRILGIAALLLLAGMPAMAAEEVRVIDTRPGVTETFLLIRPAAAPVASVVLFTGGAGALGLGPDWPVGRRGGNFLVRSADLFAQAGFLVAVIDAPSDSPVLWNRRGGEAHARDVAAVMAALRREAAVPVWLIGTSMGSVSAAGVAARLKQGGPDGVVLTSSVTKTSRMTTETVLTLDLEEIRVPLLVVNHQGDTCFAAPPGDAERIIWAAENAPRRETLVFTGGKPAQSAECEPFAAHGYFGIEPEVVAAIAKWIKGN